MDMLEKASMLLITVLAIGQVIHSIADPAWSLSMTD
jgi:hypothetical protein